MLPMKSMFNIAQQCPYAGGCVVYKARDFLRRLNDSLVYYDDAVCLQYGIFRTANISVESGEPTIKLVPNPAANTLDVMVSPSIDESCTITISNMLGEVIYKSTGENTIKLKTIDVSTLAQGLYVVSIRSNTLLKNAKLTITR